MIGFYVSLGFFFAGVLLAIFGLLWLIIRGKDANKTFSVASALSGIIISFVSFFIIKPPVPVIYPLDNENMRYQPFEVSIISDGGLKIYYSTDGSDPKSGLPYDDPIQITSTTTVATRTRSLGIFWSDIAKSHYTVGNNASVESAAKPDGNTENKTNIVFERDYSPGKENKYGNLEYYNNNALLCTQDGMYYIATREGIYKTRDFIEFFDVVEGDTILNLCVLGDWIYYSSDKTIYRVRTDGTNRETVHDTSRGVVSMNVSGDWIYFVDNEDGKLYKIIYNGEALTKLTDTGVCKFVVIDYYIYFIEGNYEKKYDTGYSFEPMKLARITIDGTEYKELPSPKDGDNPFDQRPSGLQYYDGKLYISNYYGLYSFETLTEEYILCHAGFISSLCIVDDNAFYISHYTESAGAIFCYNLTHGLFDEIETPFMNSLIPSWFYPTKHGIVFASEYSKWYIMDAKGSRPAFLTVS